MTRTARLATRLLALAAATTVAFSAAGADAVSAATTPKTSYVVVTGKGTKATVTTKRLTAAQARALRKKSTTRVVEPNGTVRIVAERQNPPSWGLDRVDQRQLPLNNVLRSASTGEGVTAYIVDTGINPTHRDFAGRLRPGFDALGGNTVDCHGHGTHVAGTVGGTSYGVAPGVTLVPIRVLNCSGSGTYEQVIAGINWAINDHTSGPAVLNMSLGGGVSAGMDDAVNRAVADGITVVVAAGNASTDACNSSPARAAAAITVAATDNRDARASFSNFGRCVDIFAPGVAITSAWKDTATAVNTISGTSMAAPHVAGVAALALAGARAATPAQIDTALKATGTPGAVINPGPSSPNLMVYADPNGNYGLTPAEPTAPAAPYGVTASPADRGAQVTWTAGFDNGSPITEFVVAATSPAGTAVVCRTAETSCTVTGLDNFTTYTFTVTATNGIGTSAPSAASPAVTPRPAPNAPTAVTATAGYEQAVVTWTAPAPNGVAITGYTVRTGNTSVCSTTATTCTVTNLTPGIAYTFTVTANATGITSVPSAPSNPATPLKSPSLPGAPTSVVATAGDTEATVTWAPPVSDGNSPIIRYDLSLAGSRTTVCSTETTSCTLTGLVNGRYYTFLVWAVNIRGTSTTPGYSNSVRPSVISGVSSAPQDVTVYPATSELALTWNAPAKLGGTIVSEYRVRDAATGSIVCSGSANRSCKVPVTTGTTASFTVEARNVFGWSKPSAPSAPVTAAPSAPSPVQNLSAVGNVRYATVRWSPAVTNGGSPVTASVITVTNAAGTVVSTLRYGFESASVGFRVNLPAGAYQFIVTLENANGTSTAAVVSASVRSR